MSRIGSTPRAALLVLGLLLPVSPGFAYTFTCTYIGHTYKVGQAMPDGCQCLARGVLQCPPPVTPPPRDALVPAGADDRLRG